MYTVPLVIEVCRHRSDAGRRPDNIFHSPLQQSHGDGPELRGRVVGLLVVVPLYPHPSARHMELPMCWWRVWRIPVGFFRSIQNEFLQMIKHK